MPRSGGKQQRSCLLKEYPEFRGINGNMHLGTLEKKLDAPSLSQVLKTMRRKSKR